MQQTETPFIHPVPVKEIIVVTELMREMESRVLASHHLGALSLWYGSAGAGKSTTADWTKGRCNGAFNPAIPHTFKAVHYEVGKLKAGFGNEAKHAIRSFYNAVSGMTIDEGYYGRCTAEEFADLAVDTAQRQRIQLIFIDEAGLLSLDAIGGLILISDKARQRKFPISIVLIGMDDLPQKLKSRPQIRRRVPEWCHFQHYNLEQTFKLLQALHPYFATLNKGNQNDWDQVKFVHEISQGLPGYIIPFISQFDAQYRRNTTHTVNLVFLRAIHLRSVHDTNDILNQSSKNGNPKEPATNKKKSAASK